MPAWTVRDRLDVELSDVHEVHIRVVGGEVVVTTGEGPARLQAEVVRGPALEVSNAMETLRVEYGEWPLSGLKGLIGGPPPEALVVLTVPVETSVEVTTVSASVVVADLAGPLRVSTVSGAVTLKNVREATDVKTVSGRLDAAEIHGELKVKTVSGSVALAGGMCRALDAKTVSGEISLNIDLYPTGAYDVTTVSGPVGLLLGDDPSLLVEATSFSGRLYGDFGMHFEQRPGRKFVRQRIGTGEARLSVKTLSGDLRLLKRRVAA